MASATQALQIRFGTQLAGAQKEIAGFAASSATVLKTLGLAAKLATSDLAAMGAAAPTVYNAVKLLGSAGVASAEGVVKLSSKVGGLSAFLLEMKIGLAVAGAALTAYGLLAELAAEQVKKLQAISKGAEAGGVGSTFFQVFTAQAAALKLEVRDLETALVNARKASTESVDGTTLKRNINPIQATLQEAYLGGSVKGRGLGNFMQADTNEQKIKAVITAIRELEEAGQHLIALKLGEMMFGAGGAEKIVKGIADGKLNMDALTDSATAAGAVFNEGLVKRSEELDQRLKIANTTLDAEMKPLMAQIADWGLQIKDGWVSIREGIVSAVQVAKDMLGTVKSIVDLLPQTALSGRSRADVGDMFDRSDFNRKYAPAPGWAGWLSHGSNSDLFDMAGGEQARRQQQLLASRNKELYGAPASGPTDVPVPERRPPPSGFLATKTPHEGHARAARAGAAATDNVAEYIKQLQQAQQLLDVQLATEGKSNAEKAKALDLLKATQAAQERGKPLTDAERKAVEDLAVANAKLKDSIDGIKKAHESAAAQAKYFGDLAYSAVEAMIQPGAKAADVLKNLAKSLEQAALKAALLGEGPLANLFGTAGKGAGGAGGGLFGLFSGLGGGGAAGGAAKAGGIGSDAVAGAASAGGGLMAWIGSLLRFDEGGQVPGSPGAPTLAMIHGGEIILNAAQQANMASNLRGGAPGIVFQDHAGVSLESRWDARRQEMHLIATERAQSLIRGNNQNELARQDASRARRVV